MTKHFSEVIVIGGGVSGLTSAIRLLEQGHKVRILTRELPHQTTSHVAAALWYPYRVFPENRAVEWARVACEVFYQLAENPAAGVFLSTFLELYDTPMPDPWWKPAVRQFGRPTGKKLPAAYVDGYEIEAPIIEMPIFLPFLLDWFYRLGGMLEIRDCPHLAELAAPGRLLVNCTGVGARTFAADPTVYPIRGQVIRVQPREKIRRSIADEYGPMALTYVIARSNDCILGGTAQVDEWETVPDAATAADILRRCLVLEPALQDSTILEHKVGLRPGRPEVRLELEHLTPDAAVIHNYGHGGAGVTLSWGCAAEVATLAERFRKP
ncbi:MAG: FAD-binding oxidoreductase [Blastocatellia bacterium]|nr:FAD-binding oxidoreductase [Blastocatellia bacterium]